MSQREESSSANLDPYSAVFKDALTAVLTELKLPFALKDKQIEILSHIYDLKDVFALLPTGFGKSLLYQITPLLLKHHPRWANRSPICIVITPLNSIMHEQILKLGKMGISACGLDMVAESSVVCTEVNPHDNADSDQEDEDELLERRNQKIFTLTNGSMDDVKAGKYSIIFAHPEAFVTSDKGKALLSSPLYKHNVCCVAIDEGHLIQDWKEFRNSFQDLGKVLEKFDDVPHLVLSATASPASVRWIEEKLQLRKCVHISISPNRPNISYFKFRRPHTDDDGLQPILAALADELMRKGKDTPLTIVYGNLYTVLSGFRYFKRVLPVSVAYAGDPSPENRTYAQYHADYPEPMKLHIINDLSKPVSITRIVFSTVALGMGLDARSIRRIVHFKAPHSIEQYMQETGRAGRDGEPATAWLFWNGQDCKKDKKTGLKNSMKAFCEAETECLRKILLSHLGDKSNPVDSSLPCCGNCNKRQGIVHN